MWRLRPDSDDRQQRTKRGDPNRNRQGAHPSTKTLHMLEAQPHATQSDAGQAPISEIRPQSSRRDFIQSVLCTSRASHNSVSAKQNYADLSRVLVFSTDRKSCYFVSSRSKIKVASNPRRLTADTIPRTVGTPNFSFKIGRRKRPIVAPSFATPAANPLAVPRNCVGNKIPCSDGDQ